MFNGSPLVLLPVAGLILGASSGIAVHLIAEHTSLRAAEPPQIAARATIAASGLPPGYRPSRNVVITREPRAYAAIANADWFRRTPPVRAVAESAGAEDHGPAGATDAASNPSSAAASGAVSNAEHFSVVGTVALGGRTLAYVRDDRAPQAALRHLRVGDALDEGTIVLIHPRGVVVRCPPANGEASADYFYEIGQTLSSRTPLTSAGLSDVDLEATSVTRPVRQ